MIDEVRAGRVCDTLANKLSQTVDSLNLALTAGQKLIDIRTTERDLKFNEAQLWEKRFSNLEALQKVEIKKALKKGNKKMVSGAVIGFLAALVLL